MIADQTNLYAQQKGHSFAKVTVDEIKTFVFIVMLSGYLPVPQRRLLWSDGLDCHNMLVTSSMRVNRFEEIMRNLHIANNAHIDDERLYKVRPIINAINAAGKIIGFSSNLSVDESMLPYYGRHSTKQYIRGKPVRFGFKMWCLCGHDGFLYHAQTYAGSDTHLPESGLGHGPDVVLGLLEQANVQAGHTVGFDNLFTSLDLGDELNNRRIGFVGTIRENRCGGIPLTSKKEMEKKSVGGILAVHVMVAYWLTDGKTIKWSQLFPTVFQRMSMEA